MKVLILLATFAISVYAKPSRIIGGNEAEEGAYPYQISLQTKGWFGFTSHVCGGSIIRPNIIITAGHCIADKKYVVKAGLWKRHNSNHVQVVDVKRTLVHEDFGGDIGPNDIALILIASDLVYNEYVQPIVLPEFGEEFAGYGILTGWGKRSNFIFASMAETLQVLTVPFITDQECVDAFMSATGQLTPFSGESNICSGPLYGGQSACNGDSGGPVAKGGKLVGIVSWGMQPCASEGIPVVYTEVSHFIDWIYANI